MTDDTVESVETETKTETEAPEHKTTVTRSKGGKAEAKITDGNDYLVELRKENAKLRKTVDEQANAKAEELSNKKLEELRKATEEAALKNAQELVDKRLAEIEEQSRSRLVKSEIRAHAMKANVIDFDDLYDIMKKSIKAEFDADGEMTNAAQLVAEMKEKKPHLFGGVNTASTAPSPVRRDTPVKPEKVALKMSREEYERSKRALTGT